MCGSARLSSTTAGGISRGSPDTSVNWTCSTTKPFLKWRRTCHKSISSLTGVPARLLLAIFDWSIVTQINLGSKKNKSREIPSTYFPCPVPSGLPHRLHCVPMNIKRCGFKVFGGEIFPRVQHKSDFVQFAMYKKIFLYFLSSIFCFNMTDCISCFLLYKEFKSGLLFERGLLQNQSNSRLFGYSILSKLVISSCRIHEPKL